MTGNDIVQASVLRSKHDMAYQREPVADAIALFLRLSCAVELSHRGFAGEHDRHTFHQLQAMLSAEQCK